MSGEPSYKKYLAATDVMEAYRLYQARYATNMRENDKRLLALTCFTPSTRTRPWWKRRRSGPRA